MRPIVHRVCLLVLAASGYPIGLWAYVAPMNWYNTFPGFGMRWLPVLGPYNEHFVTDVGGMYLALATLAAWALVNLGNRPLILATAASWTVFNALHLSYHATMLHMYGTRDAVLNVVALGTVLVCSVLLAVPTRKQEQP